MEIERIPNNPKAVGKDDDDSYTSITFFFLWGGLFRDSSLQDQSPNTFSTLYAENMELFGGLTEVRTGRLNCLIDLFIM